MHSVLGMDCLLLRGPVMSRRDGGVCRDGWVDGGGGGVKIN